jgi:hypothetical protein
MTDADDKQKAKEDWLRQELRANRTLAISQIQWGVTVLAGVELNLFYIRQDVTKHLVELGVLKPGELPPLLRWSMGTFLLLILASIFTTYLNRTIRHHVECRKQLLAMNPSYSGITEAIPTGGSINKLHYFLFFIFPALDFTVWAMFYAGRFKLSLPW